MTLFDLRLFLWSWLKWRYSFRVAWRFAFCRDKMYLEDLISQPLYTFGAAYDAEAGEWQITVDEAVAASHTLAASGLTAEDVANAFRNMKDHD